MLRSDPRGDNGRTILHDYCLSSSFIFRVNSRQKTTVRSLYTYIPISTCGMCVRVRACDGVNVVTRTKNNNNEIKKIHSHK